MRSADPSAHGRRSAASRAAIGGGRGAYCLAAPGRYFVRDGGGVACCSVSVGERPRSHVGAVQLHDRPGRRRHLRVRVHLPAAGRQRRAAGRRPLPAPRPRWTVLRAPRRRPGGGRDAGVRVPRAAAVHGGRGRRHPALPVAARLLRLRQRRRYGQTIPLTRTLAVGQKGRRSTSFGWGNGGNVTSAGWQVILCDPIWHVSSRSGEASR